MERRPNTSDRFVCRFDRVLVFLRIAASVVMNKLNLFSNLTWRRVPHRHGLSLTNAVLASNGGMARLLLENKLNVGILGSNRLNLRRKKLSHAVGAAAPVAVLKSDLFALKEEWGIRWSVDWGKHNIHVLLTGNTNEPTPFLTTGLMN